MTNSINLELLLLSELAVETTQIKRIYNTFVPLTPPSLLSHSHLTPISLLSHSPFTSLITPLSLPYHSLITPFSLPFHSLFTPLSLPYHSLITPLSLPYHSPFTPPFPNSSHTPKGWENTSPPSAESCGLSRVRGRPGRSASRHGGRRAYRSRCRPPSPTGGA